MILRSNRTPRPIAPSWSSWAVHGAEVDPGKRVVAPGFAPSHDGLLVGVPLSIFPVARAHTREKLDDAHDSSHVGEACWLRSWRAHRQASLCAIVTMFMHQAACINFLSVASTSRSVGEHIPCTFVNASTGVCGATVGGCVFVSWNGMPHVCDSYLYIDVLVLVLVVLVVIVLV